MRCDRICKEQTKQNKTKINDIGVADLAKTVEHPGVVYFSLLQSKDVGGPGDSSYYSFILRKLCTIYLLVYLLIPSFLWLFI